MRIASYNVENLFERAKALEPSTWNVGAPILAAHAEINALFNELDYTDEIKKRILELLEVLGLLRADSAALAELRVIRGKLLLRHRDGTVEVAARGRAGWIGWVELKTEVVDELAMRHTAMVMRDLQADILGVVEADSRPTLQMFSTAELSAIPHGVPFAHCLLVDGNDPRGIDVGLLTREDFEVTSIRTHIFDEDDDGVIFSRDCCEYHLEAPDHSPLVVLMNHFKSKGYGSPDDKTGAKRRLRQSTRVASIYESLKARGLSQVVVLGDLNDTPDSDSLKPLLQGTDLRDISTHDKFDWAGRQGTFGGTKEKID